MNPVIMVKVGLAAKKHWKKILPIMFLLMFLLIKGGGGGFMPIIAVGVDKQDELLNDYKEIAEETGLYWPDLLLYHALLLMNDFTNVEREQILEVAKSMVRYRLQETSNSNGDSSTRIVGTYKHYPYYEVLKNQYNVNISESKEEISVQKLASYADKIESENASYNTVIIYLNSKDPELWDPLTQDQKDYWEALSITLPIQFDLIQPETGDPNNPDVYPIPETDSFFIWPAPGLNHISSFFGETDGRSKPHLGTDLVNRAGRKYTRGQDAIAPAEATVYRLEDNPRAACGLAVRLNHANGFQTRYCHLDQIMPLKVGQKIKQGQVIGKVGNTGSDTTGPHLHVEFKENGVLKSILPKIISTKPK
ncbi:M23 family peptidase [Brevibacillus sp. VP]|uniref:M23 family metallopeptidase n=1 Tax=Brevibacillus sp. VP TaxID=2293326 RepID=UPI000E2E4CF5|nr:M23 family metallopeptidase [Brevibacillus sp. VP]RFB28281.1 M23 family peptidase [Brevibacillus sp. VP]